MEYMEHGGVIGEYVGGEFNDTTLTGDFQQLLKHGDTQAMMLPDIFDDSRTISTGAR